MKRILKSSSFVVPLALLIAAVSLNAQTHVEINVPIFSEDFSSYTTGTPPTILAAGGKWATASHTGAGTWEVREDDLDEFGQGITNKFLRVTNTYNMTLVTPTFALSQEVVSFAFDFIGRFVTPPDGNRWLNVDPRAGTLSAHVTSMRMFDATIRTAGTDTPPNPSYGGNDVPVRILTIVNNRDDTISYDRPDGLGTANLSSAMATVWVYHYTGVNAGTWQYLIPQYSFARSATMPLGAVMNNLRLTLDSNTTLRSFDIDNIEVLGSIAPLPPVYVEIPHLLFSEDFNSYTPDTPPTTTEEGGKWGTATWNGITGSWGVVVDEFNVFGQGTENRFLRLVSTHNLNPGLITPAFDPPQEVVKYEFDFFGRFHEFDGNRWVNIDARAGAMSAHVTSARMSNHTLRSDTLNPSYGGNDLPIRIVTVMNNRAEPIIYDRPDGLGTTILGSARASVWIYHYNGTSSQF